MGMGKLVSARADDRLQATGEREKVIDKTKWYDSWTVFKLVRGFHVFVHRTLFIQFYIPRKVIARKVFTPTMIDI
jgi:viroplasmin and RNaseH domain-containing protein